LKVYRLSFQLATEVFELTNLFPKEEKYSLTDQIRRSSRGICALIAVAWPHRKYSKSFVNKLIIAKGEVAETEVWIDFSQVHGYIPQEKHTYLIEKYNEVGKMLNSMIIQPEKFCHE